MSSMQYPVTLSEITEHVLNTGEYIIHTKLRMSHRGGLYDVTTASKLSSNVLSVQSVACVVAPPRPAKPSLFTPPDPMIMMIGLHEDAESIAILLSQMGYDVVFSVGSIEEFHEIENTTLITSLIEYGEKVDIRISPK